MMYYPGMMWDYGFFSPFHLIGGIFELIIWVAVVAVIIRIIRGRKHGDWMSHLGDRSALNILRERYANGEINKEEYEERKKVLEHR